jgi:hypothetical protein
MENQSPFDLNLAIQHWREDLDRSSAFQSENLNELESHLRDSIDTLRKGGLSDDEAFLIATRRVGNAQKLEREFGKVNVAAVQFDRFLWILVAIQLWFLVSSASIALISAALPGSADLSEVQPLGLAMVFAPIPIGVATVLIWRCLIWPMLSSAVRFQKLLHQPATVALTLFVLGALFTFVAAWALRTWYYPIVAHHIGYSHDVQMRLFFSRLPYLAFWSVVTFLIARKRVRRRAA